MTGDPPPACDVYGAGEHGRVVSDVLRARGIRVRYRFDDRPPGRHGAMTDVLPGIRLTGPEGFAGAGGPMILAVGSNAARAELDGLLDADFPVVVHPSATVSVAASIGDGTVVLSGAVVQANAGLGRHVVIGAGATVGHDCAVGDFAHIGARATLCGEVRVGEGSRIGPGAVVIPSVRIGRWCHVGEGAVVIRDVVDHETVAGNPARVG